MGRNTASNSDSRRAHGAMFLARAAVALAATLAVNASVSGSAFAQSVPKASVSVPAPTAHASVSATAPAAPAVPSAPAAPAVPVVPAGATVAAGVPVVPGAAVTVAPATSAATVTPPGGAVVVPVAGTAAVPGVPSATPSGDKPMDGATYAVRLRDLEASVDELKDRIRRSHTRLALLSDTILSGGAAGSRAEISVDNEMSSAFRLTKALVVLDGAVQYNRADDSGALADQKSIPVFSGSVPPGDHTLQVVLSFQGNGYGVFSYLRSYHWDLKSSHSFTAVEGKTLTLAATALEKGGVTTPLDQRPSVEWKEKVQSLSPSSDGGGPTAAPASAPPAAPAAGTSK
jgi:hypothetical protein